MKLRMMIHGRGFLATIGLAFGATIGGAVSPAAAAGSAGQQTRGCDIAAAEPWIDRWMAAWELTSREILRLPEIRSPDLVFYDASCVFTTSVLTAGTAAQEDGSDVRGRRWWAVPHEGAITLPNGDSVPIQLMSFTASDERSGPFVVMAAPAFWEQAGHGQEPALTAVLIHELTHTQQLPGMAPVIGPIDETWPFEEELSDDAVQDRFGSDSVYVAAYLAERDLLYRAVDAGSMDEARTLAGEALAMMQARHARWFVDDDAVFSTLDATWLSMEGAGQWAASAWLAYPAGGGLDRAAAVSRMLGQRRWWVQDEGLALFLVIDRLLPEWPSLVFTTPSAGAVELLERAVSQPGSSRSGGISVGPPVPATSLDFHALLRSARRAGSGAS